MKEELTTAMHSEFNVDIETDIKHKAFSVWKQLSFNAENEVILKRAESFGITLEQALKYKDDYFELRLNK